MKSCLLYACALLLWGSSWGKNGDTLEVNTHQNVLIQTDPSKGNTRYYGWGNFPKEGKYQRVYAELSFKCPDNLRCGEWDYLNYIYLRTRKGNYNDTTEPPIFCRCCYGLVFYVARWLHCPFDKIIYGYNCQNK